ncbi:hypothetical protein [Acinetobacter junii]|uniref:hypothetical protein n=1 Tax=Acinetobacter junii TaxID=40215 RepID=UPI00309B3EEF
MAKYSQPKFAQAVLKNLPKHIALSRLKYVITAKTSEAKSTYVSKLMCAEKTGGFNLVNYRHSSGVYHEQETEDLHRRI